ncbi:hypothetical protein VTN77DRAFT_9765 [Rasamsonia byssochlamydoides]|uniref:uncharacterized protein n=1 Tax=Rasamsonia byssochlamydoides TaxID=89139 RepID=UPI0037436C70
MAETTSSSSITTALETRLPESFWQQRQPPSRSTTEQSDSEENTSSSSSRGHLQPPHQSPKSRSLSDAAKHAVALQSPALRELSRSSKDDTALSNNNPATPQKTHPSHPSLHGLSLHLPPRPFATNSPGAGPSISRAPLSPKLDVSQIYGSPASVLPRRSRGLDFSRACTNLHHSTLAESSPDSSPTIGGRGVNIPQRRGTGTTGFGSPSTAFGQHFGSGATADRTAMSSSVSSVNMLESDTSSSEDDDDDDPMNGDRDDVMITATPLVNKVGGSSVSNPFGAPLVQSPGSDWMGVNSPAGASLLSFQRARYRSGRKTRHSSSSSSKPSPGPLSPPVLKSIETSNGGYFAREMSKSAVQSRRESLSLGTRDLYLSDLSDDGDSQATRGDSPAGAESGARAVIRRAVTRRGNLLPKPKNFARIRAALMEESAPLESEAKREAEVIRQVRESDPTIQSKSPTFPLDKLPKLNTTAGSDGATNPSTSADTSFRNQASRNSGGVAFWNSFDGRYRTPPPPAGMAGPSSVQGEDMTMETPQSTVEGRRSPTPQAGNAVLATELRRKRRRDDDLDPESFKRRAVSPGMSVQSSPVLAHSPVVKDSNAWVVPPKSTPLFPSDGSSGHSTGMKRVGLQGMNETNDGLMNMSIE